MLLTFIGNELLKVLESQLIAYEPQLQQLILDEVAALCKKVMEFVESKYQSMPAAK